MHYIEYIPGTVVHITDKPTSHGHKDVNLLSRWVVKFNNIIYLTPTRHGRNNIDYFKEIFNQFKLP